MLSISAAQGAAPKQEFVCTNFVMLQLQQKIVSSK
jgi:hypothetical protein